MHRDKNRKGIDVCGVIHKYFINIPGIFTNEYFWINTLWEYTAVFRWQHILNIIRKMRKHGCGTTVIITEVFWISSAVVALWNWKELLVEESVLKLKCCPSQVSPQKLFVNLPKSHGARYEYTIIIIYY